MAGEKASSGRHGHSTWYIIGAIVAAVAAAGERTPTFAGKPHPRLAAAIAAVLGEDFDEFQSGAGGFVQVNQYELGTTVSFGLSTEF